MTPKKTRERAHRRSETVEQREERLSKRRARIGLGVLLRLPRSDTYFCSEDSQSQSSDSPHKCLAFV